MGDAGLLKSWRDGPDLSVGACELFGDVFHHRQAFSLNPVVIGDENTHAPPHVFGVNPV